MMMMMMMYIPFLINTLGIIVNNRIINLVDRLFAYGLGDRGSIPARVIPKT